MEPGNIKNRKRKREEDQPEAPPLSPSKSLLSSPFQAIKSFFLGGNSSSDVSETPSNENPNLLSPPAKRRKNLDTPDFITSSPKSPRMIKPASPAVLSTPVRSKARRSLDPILATESASNGPITPRSSSEPNQATLAAAADSDAPQLERSKTEPAPSLTSSASQLMNFFSPMLNMFGRRASSSPDASQNQDAMDVDRDDATPTPQGQQTTPRRSSRLARVSRSTSTTTSVVTSPRGRSRVTRTSTTVVRKESPSKKDTQGVRDSPSRKAKSAAKRQIVVSSASKTRRRVVRTVTTPVEEPLLIEEAPSTPTKKGAETDSAVSPRRSRRVKAIRRVETETTTTTTTTVAVVDENAPPTPVLTRSQLSSNETLDVSPPHAGHVTVRTTRSVVSTTKQAADNDDDEVQTNALNESTVDMDTIYDEVIEEIDQSNREIDTAAEIGLDMDDDLDASMEVPEQEQEEVEEEEEEFDSFLFIASLPPRDQLPYLPLSPILPHKPSHDRKMTLILDLDETLVHCSLEPIDDADIVFLVPFQGSEFKVFVRKRPHFQEFLDRVADLFDVAIFTASQQIYADRLLNILDPQRRWSKHRLFRDSCLNVVDNYLKDLTILGRDLSRVAIVDNSPHVFAYQLDNGIPIESWFEDRDDKELLHLIPFLESLQHAEDVRPLIRDRFRLHARVEDSRNLLLQQKRLRQRPLIQEINNEETSN